MDFPLTLTEFIVGLVIAVIGSTVQGALGFGLAMVGAPVLLMVNEVYVPGSILLAACILSIMMIIREWHEVQWGEVGLATLGRASTIMPAAAMVRYLPTRIFNTVFAVAVLLTVAMSLRGWRLPLTRRNIILAGAVSGITGTIASIGGPPMAIVYQHQRGPHIRATLSAVFTIGSIMSMLGLASLGKFGLDDLKIGFALMPAVLVGFGLSWLIARRLDRHAIRPAVLGVSALSAVIVLAKTWLS